MSVLQIYWSSTGVETKSPHLSKISGRSPEKEDRSSGAPVGAERGIADQAECRDWGAPQQYSQGIDGGRILSPATMDVSISLAESRIPAVRGGDPRGHGHGVEVVYCLDLFSTILEAVRSV